MRTMTASNTQNNFGDLLDTVRREPVLLTKNKRPVGVFVSLEDLQGTYLAEMLIEKEGGYDEWVQAKVGKSLARFQKDGTRGKAAADAHTDALDNIRNKLQNR
ncbi:type II toxin-antitoxin system Phd/YefM family antitoxin [Neisseria musculi]|uniref:Antitoxin n=1 Tax=Neisseria musculi TaxID=1815583 RepID=A0A7H1MAS1_9NEIS|nr:type II toxin-antitoxin system Phd/YefM family antitoxin [Neisseria musculi]QNT58736.1 prevent-host-death family protein [Neisseria musculi]